MLGPTLLEGRAYRSEQDTEIVGKPGDEMNGLLTMTRAPIAFALTPEERPPGRRLPLTHPGRKLVISK